ncbi:hypothetical protein B0H11DRAFT_2000316 [Mycena galericulata]|nr:hypothetical protein B0H11DRAFT_2000316 [Mycena galericulata]
MPTYFRAYCDRSGCVFDEEKGFLAQNPSMIFDPSKDALEAEEILTAHLDWRNHHIPSPLISVSDSRDKPRRLAGATRKYYHGESVDIFIAEICYEVKPSNAYHMMSTAKMLGVKLSPLYVDHGEYVFVGCIPLEYIVRVEEVVEWTGEFEPAKYTTVWEKATAGQNPLDLAIEAMREMSLNSATSKDTLTTTATRMVRALRIMIRIQTERRSGCWGCGQLTVRTKNKIGIQTERRTACWGCGRFPVRTKTNLKSVAFRSI